MLMDTEARRRLGRLADAVEEAVADRPDAGGSIALGELLELLAVIDRLMARTTVLAGRALATGAAERREGLEFEALLRIAARRTYGDAKTLAVAGQVLADMPETTAMFAAQVIGWGEVRAIVYAARALNVQERSWLDASLAVAQDRLAAMEPDAVVAEVERLVASLEPATEERTVKAAYRRRFVSVQLALDGSATLNAELPADATAALLSAMDIAARRLAHDIEDAADRDVPGDGGAEAWQVWRDRAARRADGLVELAETYLAGGDDGAARPSMIIAVDAQRGGSSGSCCVDEPGERHATTPGHGADDQVAIAAIAGRSRPDSAAGDDGVLDALNDGELLWNGPRGPIRLTATELDRLSCDADYRLVLRDGTRIIGVSSSAEFVDDDLRAALHGRDRHCRFPGCRRSATHAVAHHVVWRRFGGRTVLTNLALLCGRHHWAVHHGGWRMSMDARGVCRFTYRSTTYTTLPANRRMLDPPRDPPS